MADNLEPRVSDLEQRADSADNRTDNLEIRVSKLEGQRARDRANKISKNCEYFSNKIKVVSVISE